MSCDTVILAAVSRTALNTRMTDKIDRIAFRTGPIPSRRDRIIRTKESASEPPRVATRIGESA
jgi:hypothetical protein